jgi:glutathione S-transferase
MSPQLKPIKLYGHGRTANTLKVAFILEELGLPYESVPVALTDVKKPEYTVINPNGRLPSVIDPNTGITLWESGAILEYLIETYDKDRQFSFAAATPEFWHARQWLYFQVSGQGPYYGQLGWYKLFEKEPNPSAIDRYTNETERVSSVLDGWLAQQKKEYANTDGPWLVGNKLSYADISFIPWQHVMEVALKDVYDQAKFPHVQEWFNRITSRPAVQRIFEKAAQAGGH